MTRSPAVRVQAIRRRDEGRGAIGCDVCGWRLPPSLRRGRKHLGLESHHIVPLVLGGADRVTNLAMLCPTHHKMAHRLVSARRRAGLGAIRDLEDLVAIMRRLDEEGREAAAVEQARAPNSEPPLDAVDPGRVRERTRREIAERMRLGALRRRRFGVVATAPVVALADMTLTEIDAVRSNMARRTHRAPLDVQGAIARRRDIILRLLSHLGGSATMAQLAGSMVAEEWRIAIHIEAMERDGLVSVSAGVIRPTPHNHSSLAG